MGIVLGHPAHSGLHLAHLLGWCPTRYRSSRTVCDCGASRYGTHPLGFTRRRLPSSAGHLAARIRTGTSSFIVFYHIHTQSRRLFFQTIASSLPFFNEAGRREAPTSISEVPFGRTMRVAFALEYYLKYDSLPHNRLLFAILQYIVYA